METKVITVVESVTMSGAKGPYLLITDHEGVMLSCFKEHKGLWGVLSVNAVVTVSYEVVGKYKNIMEAVPMGEQIKVDGAKITEQQVVPPMTKPAPQELGMWYKEMGNRIGDGSIDRDFPNSKVKIKGQYYKQMEAVTGISMKKED